MWYKMASFPTDLHAVIDKLTPSAPIPTAKTIDNNYSGVEAQASEQASMAQAKANQSAAQTDFALANTGLELARKEQYTQEHAKILKKQLDEQKYNNTLHKAMFQVRNIYSDALFKISNSINRDELTAITSTTNASVFGLVKALSASLPKKQSDLLQEFVQSASTHLNQVNQRKIASINYDNNYITLATGLDPAIQQIGQNYLNAADHKGRTKALEQGRDYIYQIDKLLNSATNLGQRDRAVSLRNKLQAEMHKLTTEGDVSSDNEAQQKLVQSNYSDTHNQNSLGTAHNNKTSVDNVFFNSEPTHVNQNPTGSTQDLINNHNAQMAAARLRQDVVISNTPIAVLQQGAESDNPLKRKLSKMALDKITQGKALELVIGMNPNGPLNQSLINYDKALASNDPSTVYNSYKNLRNAVHATASRWGISEDKFNLAMPNLEAFSKQFFSSVTQTDNKGVVTGYNLTSDNPYVTAILHKGRMIAHGKNLIGGSPLVKGINYAQGGAFDVIAGKGYVPVDNQQAQLDIASFDPRFQKHYASKARELYRNEVSNPNGILKARNRGSLRSYVMTSGDFQVQKIAQIMGVSEGDVSDSIMAKIEYKASKGDENAIADVQEEVTQWANRHHITTVGSSFGGENISMVVKSDVWLNYTNGKSLSDDENRETALTARNIAYKKILDKTKERVISQWGLNETYKDKSKEEIKELAINEAKRIIGKPQDYVIHSKGEQIIVSKQGEPSRQYFLTPMDVQNAISQADKVNRSKVRSTYNAFINMPVS